MDKTQARAADLTGAVAILDSWTHDAQRGNALASGDAAAYSELIRSLAEARTIVERHMLAHPEPVEPITAGEWERAREAQNAAARRLHAANAALGRPASDDRRVPA